MLKKRVLLGVLILLVISGWVWGVGGDMGVGSEPMTDGSEVYPWLIEDYDDFAAFCGNSGYWGEGVYTRLDCDLDLSVAGTYSRAPIAGDTDPDYGFDGPEYNGQFDGNNKVIRNLTISGVHYCGFFGRLGSEGTIINLGLEDVDITGDGATGGLCGYNYYGSINYCYAMGTVTGESSTGGLCGYNYYGSINYCYAKGAVTGETSTGGLCGYNKGDISYCYALGTVTGSDRTGGLCGYNRGGNISDCYATGNVTGISNYTGGLCGHNGDYCRISDCYATVYVTGSSSYTGGLCGYSYGVIYDCYATGNVAGDYCSGGLCGYNAGGSISQDFHLCSADGYAMRVQ